MRLCNILNILNFRHFHLFPSDIVVDHWFYIKLIEYVCVMYII